MNFYTASVPEVLRQAADRMDSVFVNAHQLGTPAIAALPAGRAHREVTPGRVAARVAAQRPPKGSESASESGN